MKDRDVLLDRLRPSDDNLVQPTEKGGSRIQETDQSQGRLSTVPSTLQDI